MVVLRPGLTCRSHLRALGGLARLVGAPTIASWGREVRKQFFFEKKNQKTFALMANPIDGGFP
jgi:hypothetical protein